MLRRPEPPDCHEYYFTYIRQVPEGDVLEILADEGARTVALLESLAPEVHERRYEPGKWSVKEVVGHLVDTERVFGYRALSMARGDAAPLPSFEQDDWAGVSNAGSRSPESLVAELRAVRGSTLALFRSFDDPAWERTGVASDRRFRVGVFPFILAGHELHHRRILQERYLGGTSS